MKLYTKTVCPKCLWVKSELERAGIQYEMMNIDQNEQAKEQLMEAGFFSVPVLEMNHQLIGEIDQILAKIELVAQ